MSQFKLKIKTKNQSYNVFVGKNLLKILNKSFINFNKCLLVIDNKVPKKFIIKINSLFKKKEKFVYLFNSSEINKSQKTINKLLDILLKKRKTTDRDHFKNKRIETSGILFAQLFRKLYKNSLKSLKLSIQKEINSNLIISVEKFIKVNIIENGLKYALATGNWNSKVGYENKKIGIILLLSVLILALGCLFIFNFDFNSNSFFFIKNNFEITFRK